MKDAIAKWVYLSCRQKCWRQRFIWGLYLLTLRWGFLPRIWARGRMVWSAEMFDKQLDGL